MHQENGSGFFAELLKFVVIAALIVFPIRFFVAQPFIVSGDSMDPTFANGQYLIVDELTYRFESPQRGDVIILRYPRNPSEFFIKRIIGLPGEVVNIHNNTISITQTDGQTIDLTEPYVVNMGDGPDATYTIPQGQYFVMGDNRPASSDSRVWGLLPAQNIVGRALVRLLPFQSATLFPGSAHY